MKKINILFYLLIISALYCCSDDNQHYLNGELRKANLKRVSKLEVTSEQVELGDVSTGMAISAYDSLIICWNPAMTTHFYNIFNVDSGEMIGSFCEKGRGNNEMISAGCIYQLFKEQGDLMTFIYESNSKKLFKWNISRSIECGKTIYDTIIPYDNNRLLWQFYRGDNQLLDYKPSHEMEGNLLSAPYYERRTIPTNELLQVYHLYDLVSLPDNLASSPLYTWDAIKPDGSKIVQVMKYFPRINILDSNDGSFVSYAVEDKPDFSILDESSESKKIYYNQVHADDRYIYATYWGRKQWRGSTFPHFNTIHIFDWDGNMIYELTTDHSYFSLWIDRVRNRLYTIDMNSEKVYFIDLTKL